MKPRICFSFAAVVALVLAVAAIPSYATERRDSLIIMGAQQAQSAKGSHPHHAKAPRADVRTTQHQNAASVPSDKSGHRAESATFEGKDLLTPENGSSKGTRTSAGK
jgi:hypothetical protein